MPFFLAQHLSWFAVRLLFLSDVKQRIAAVHLLDAGLGTVMSLLDNQSYAREESRPTALPRKKNMRPV